MIAPPAGCSVCFVADPGFVGFLLTLIWLFLRFADTPFWNRLRLVCLILFWLAWLGLIAAIVTLTIVLPRCTVRISGSNIFWIEVDANPWSTSCYWPIFLLQKTRTSVFLVEPLTPLFWTSGDICPMFQSQGWSRHLNPSSPVYNGFNLGVTPADHMVVSIAAELV